MDLENERVYTGILYVPSRIYTKKESRTEKSPSTAQTQISNPSVQAPKNLPPSLRIFERRKKKPPTYQCSKSSSGYKKKDGAVALVMNMDKSEVE